MSPPTRQQTADGIATTHPMWAESTSEALIAAAIQFDSDRIVVGASRTGVLQRFTVGSIANALLHASPVPVALAPRGFVDAAWPSGIICAIGTRPGWKALLSSMVAISEGLAVDLPFVTLVEVGAGRSTPDTDSCAGSQPSVHSRPASGGFSIRPAGVTTPPVCS